MSQQSLTALITNLRSQTEANSITPEILGNVLQQMVDEIGNVEAAQTAARDGEFLFASLQGIRVPGAAETELLINSSKSELSTFVVSFINFSSSSLSILIT